MSEQRVRRRNRRRRNSGDTNALQARGPVQIGTNFDTLTEPSKPSPRAEKIDRYLVKLVSFCAIAHLLSRWVDELSSIQTLTQIGLLVSFGIAAPTSLWINREKLKRELQRTLEKF